MSHFRSIQSFVHDRLITTTNIKINISSRFFEILESHEDMFFRFYMFVITSKFQIFQYSTTSIERVYIYDNLLFYYYVMIQLCHNMDRTRWLPHIAMKFLTVSLHFTIVPFGTHVVMWNVIFYKCQRKLIFMCFCCFKSMNQLKPVVL